MRFCAISDWAKGDFAAANKKLGTDYGCSMAPGNQDAYVMTVDVFVFPKNTNADQQSAQNKLATLMMDPAVQTEFNAFKGSPSSKCCARFGVPGARSAK